MSLTLVTGPTDQGAQDGRGNWRSGVYAIRCVASGRLYIGSAVIITKRWINHRHDLERSRHHNRHLQNAWRKYGPSNFKFFVLEYCDPQDLLRVEQRYLDQYLSRDRRALYNMNPTAGSPLGRTFGPEARARMSAARRGRALSAAHRAKISERMRGNTHRLGIPHTKETLAKLREWRKGKTPALGYRMSEEQKAAVSARFKGRTLPSAHRAKIAAALRGKRKSDEHRRKVAQLQAAKKLAPEIVKEIRRLKAAGVAQAELARRFRVSDQTISNVVRHLKAYAQ